MRASDSMQQESLAATYGKNMKYQQSNKFNTPDGGNNSGSQGKYFVEQGNVDFGNRQQRGKGGCTIF